MKRFPLFFLLLLLIGLSGCGRTVAGIGIPANQEFILGEGRHGSYKATLKNKSTTDVMVSVRDKDTKEQTQGFGLSGTATVRIGANEVVHLINESDQAIEVKATLSRSKVEGMRYQTIKK
ncbi:MAG: hypothetical protein AAF840_15625 [Bacteroidota bacterium]